MSGVFWRLNLTLCTGPCDNITDELSFSIIFKYSPIFCRSGSCCGILLMRGKTISLRVGLSQVAPAPPAVVLADSCGHQKR